MKNSFLLSGPLMLLIGAAIAADAPPLKEGFWSIHSVTTEQPSGKKREVTRSICRNHAYDDHVKELAKKTAPTCKTIGENSSGGSTTIETECSVQNTVIHSKTTNKIVSETALHSETHATYEPALAGMSEMTMVMDQTFTGACPAGIDPGDMVGPDGKKVASWKH